MQHPLVPLDRTVFALNIDGGGYSDTTIATVIGLERTTADALIAAGAAAYGLNVIPDPAPEQNLFDRSDNVNFARQGIPAPTFSPGFRSFSDPGVATYYHRPQDEADDDFDYAYLRRFVQAYAHAARRIADSPYRPVWKPGDTYEPAARALRQQLTPTGQSAVIMPIGRSLGEPDVERQHARQVDGDEEREKGFQVDLHETGAGLRGSGESVLER